MSRLVIAGIFFYAGYKFAKFQEEAEALGFSTGTVRFNENGERREVPVTVVPGEVAEREIAEITSESYKAGRKEAGEDRDFIEARYRALFLEK